MSTSLVYIVSFFWRSHVRFCLTSSTRKPISSVSARSFQPSHRQKSFYSHTTVQFLQVFEGSSMHFSSTLLPNHCCPWHYCKEATKNLSPNKKTSPRHEHQVLPGGRESWFLTLQPWILIWSWALHSQETKRKQEGEAENSQLVRVILSPKR